MPQSDVEEFFDGKASGEGAASDSQAPAQETAAPEKADSSEPVEAKQAAEPDEEKDEPLPRDVEALQKTVLAVRGDRRRDRKKWREVETALQEERKQLEAERRDRARLEGELNALRRSPSAAEATKAEQKRAGFWEHDDPDKYIDEKVSGVIGSYAVEQRRREIKRDEAVMRRTHEDFDESVAAFRAVAESNPQFVEAFNRSDDPVGFAYQQGKELMRLQQYEATSVSELEAKIEARIRAELGTGQATQAPQAHQPSARAPIPNKSIASARGSGASVTKEWSGPRSADSFFTGPRI